MNRHTGAIYSDLSTAKQLDPEPEALVEVPPVFGVMPQRTRPVAYRAVQMGGKAARLLKGQRRRASGK